MTREAAETNAALTSVLSMIRRSVVTVIGQAADDMSAAGVLCNGTGLLVRTPERRFLVTADHVLGGTSSEGRIRIVLGDRGKNISDWKIIDRDARVDLGTVEIPDTFDVAHLARQCFVPSWPLHRAERGDSAIVIGFPGDLRRPSAHTLEQGAIAVADFVASSSDRRFVIVDEEDERLPRGRPPQSAGGMSGAPIFVARDGRPSWAGVLIAGADTIAQLFAAHADFILPNGDIDRSRIA